MPEILRLNFGSSCGSGHELTIRLNGFAKTNGKHAANANRVWPAVFSDFLFVQLSECENLQSAPNLQFPDLAHNQHTSLLPEPVLSTRRGDLSPELVLSPGLGENPFRGSLLQYPRGRTVPPGDFDLAPISLMFRVPPGDLDESPGRQYLRLPSGVRLGLSPVLPLVAENFLPPGLALAGREYATGLPRLPPLPAPRFSGSPDRFPFRGDGVRRALSRDC